MADLVEECLTCGRVYNKTKLMNCPGCEVAEQQTDAPAAYVPTRANKANRAERELTEAEKLDEIVRELKGIKYSVLSTSNRLKNVTAFLWTTVWSTIVGSVLFVLAAVFKNYDGSLNLFWLVAALVVSLVGTISALVSLYNSNKQD